MNLFSKKKQNMLVTCWSRRPTTCHIICNLIFRLLLWCPKYRGSVFCLKIQFLSYLNLKHPINTLRINTNQSINSKYLKRVKKPEIKLNWIWLPQLKYVFSINIKTLNNHHRASFIVWNPWTQRKTFLVVRNCMNDDFFSYLWNLVISLSPL